MVMWRCTVSLDSIMKFFLLAAIFFFLLPVAHCLSPSGSGGGSIEEEEDKPPFSLEYFQKRREAAKLRELTGRLKRASDTIGYWTRAVVKKLRQRIHSGPSRSQRSLMSRVPGACRKGRTKRSRKCRKARKANRKAERARRKEKSSIIAKHSKLMDMIEHQKVLANDLKEFINLEDEALAATTPTSAPSTTSAPFWPWQHNWP